MFRWRESGPIRDGCIPDSQRSRRNEGEFHVEPGDGGDGDDAVAIACKEFTSRWYSPPLWLLPALLCLSVRQLVSSSARHSSSMAFVVRVCTSRRAVLLINESLSIS